MSNEMIPTNMFIAIHNRENVFLTQENQWYFGGYVFFEDQVHHFYVDRKSQYDELYWSLSIEEALKQHSFPREVRKWIQSLKKR